MIDSTSVKSKELLSPYLSKFLDALVMEFLSRVKEYDSGERWNIKWQPEHDGRPYYNKWISTLRVSSKLGVSCNSVRYNLTKLEKLGLVKAKRKCNHIEWAALDIPGFEQMIYEDYYWRTK